MKTILVILALVMSSLAQAQSFTSVYHMQSFQRTCTITSAAANVAIPCLSASDVPAGKTAYLTNFLGKVNGATLWATVASCSIKDTAGAPVSLVQIPVADLTANAVVGPYSANLVLGTGYSLGLGATAGKGLSVVCNAAGTGSDLVVTVSGVFK